MPNNSNFRESYGRRRSRKLQNFEFRPNNSAKAFISKLQSDYSIMVKFIPYEMAFLSLICPKTTTLNTVFKSILNFEPLNLRPLSDFVNIANHNKNNSHVIILKLSISFKLGCDCWFYSNTLTANWDSKDIFKE